MKKMSVSARAARMLARLALAAGTGALSPAMADEVAEFYRGRQVQVVIGHEVGGGTGASTNPVTLPKIIYQMLGSNILVVAGYPSANNVLLAMERGEVNCIGSHSWSTAKVTVAHHLRESKLNMLVQW